MSLRTVINLRILFSFIFILILGGVIAVWQARHSVAKEVESSINLALQMVEFGFEQVPVAERQGIDWLPQLTALKQTRHLNIAILDGDNDPINLLSHQKNEQTMSPPPSWFVHAVKTEYITKQYSIKMADGSSKTLLIKAEPLDEIIEAWREYQSFFWSMVAMLLMIFLAINLVFNSVLKTVNAILSGLQRIEDGRYDSALPNFDIAEFDRIANEINKMTAALNTAQHNNQALARHTMQIQESERQNLSRELHDEMGQSLTAIKAMAVTAKQANVDTHTIADSIISVCNDLAVVVRSMMRTLHPLSLTELGLEATLTDMVNEWHRRSPSLEIDLSYDFELEQVDHELAIHCYRIVQECLTNVVRHAEADHVWVSVTKQADEVHICVKDDGAGDNSSQRGFGVLGMQERAHNMGGTFHFDSIKDEGVTVTVTLPFRAQ